MQLEYLEFANICAHWGIHALKSQLSENTVYASGLTDIGAHLIPESLSMRILSRVQGVDQFDELSCKAIKAIFFDPLD